MPPAIKGSGLRAFLPVIVCVLALAGLGVSPAGQSPPPARRGESEERRGQEYRIRREVDLVVLHATVVDERGEVVTNLKQENFRVFEDRVEQTVSIFRREDIPVTLGLVIDNSGSMLGKRERVNAAALAFVQTSNPQDEVFIVNFNDDYFLDLPSDFTSDINEMKDALERIDSRGGTALYDAIIGSLDHLKKGTRQKKALLVISDGEDTASQVGSSNKRRALELTTLETQKSEAVIYTVGLLGVERKREAREARKALRKLSEASGGLAYFPETLAEIEPICTRIAHDIRSQYILAYYPTNTRKDGGFRAVQVQLIPPRNRGKLSVRTRTGYYAQKQASGY